MKSAPPLGLHLQIDVGRQTTTVHVTRADGSEESYSDGHPDYCHLETVLVQEVQMYLRAARTPRS
jgi:hypothetical protein